MMVLNLENNATVRLIMAIDERANYISAIQRKTWITGSAISKIVKTLEKDKFMSAEQSGRIRTLKLTIKGEKLKLLLQEILKL